MKNISIIKLPTEPDVDAKDVPGAIGIVVCPKAGGAPAA